jgi:FkbM family methyltransferase
MPKSLSHYRQKLAERGIGEIVSDRLRWYKKRFQINNWWIGRLVELSGNKIKVDGVTLSLDNPQILTMHKSLLYFGIYEIGERDLARRYIDRSLPLVEIGASIGGVSCITNRLLTEPARHVVIECNPINLPTLAKNRELNRCQFTIEPFAIAYGDSSVTFNIVPGGFTVGNLAGLDGEKITVKTTTLKAILDKHKFQTVSVVSDCEGAEVDIVENEPDILRYRVKRLILEIHPKLRGADAIAKTLQTLADIGFDITEHAARKEVLAMTNRHLS